MNTPRTLFTLALALALVPATALADHDDDDHDHDGVSLIGSFGAGVLFGDTLDEGESPLFDHGVDIDESGWFEARLGIRPNEWLELEGSVSFAPTGFTVEGDDSGLFGGSGDVTLADVDIWHYTGSVNFHFDDDAFDPFVTLGAGAATYDVDLGGVDADTKFALVFGGGFNYWVNHNFGIRMDVRDYITVLDVDSGDDDYYDEHCDCYYDYDSDSDTLHNAAVTAGITFRSN